MSTKFDNYIMNLHHLFFKLKTTYSPKTKENFFIESKREENNPSLH